MNFTPLIQGGRIFLSSIRQRVSPKKYSGSAEQICRQIVTDCWNGRFFQTSTNTFAQFWTRDFGFCAQALLNLGYQQEVHQTLRYALNHFNEKGKVACAITAQGKPFDFPTYAVDSLPWLIHSLKISKFPYYSFKEFLNREITHFTEIVINPSTGLVRPDVHFSSMKDHAIRRSSCYDNCMVGMLAHDLAQMKNLLNPLSQYDYPSLLVRHFWNGRYFYDDLRKQEYVAGDANVFPFLLGLCSDKNMLESALNAIRSNELDKPFPLKYTRDRAYTEFIWQEMFARNYEGDTVWMHMGPLFVKLIKQTDSELAAKYKERYLKLIEKHNNYLEVFTSAGEPFRTPFYYSDHGMLWAANYLML